MADIGPYQLLEELGDGKTMDDLYEKLSLVLAAVRLSHKKGSINLKIEIEPGKDTEVERVWIRGDVTAKIPHVERGAETYYLTETNDLSRRHPRQANPDEVVSMARAASERLDGQSRAAGEKE